jgi:RNA polymerase sigma-70 factor (ECF subfamily)
LWRLEKTTRNTVEIQSLIDGVRGGDSLAFEKLYDTYSEAIYGILFQVVKSDEVASDLLQDTFVKFWTHCNTYDETKGTIFTWLLNVARNKGIDHQRKITRRKTSNIQEGQLDVSNFENDDSGVININHIGMDKMIKDLDEDHQFVLRYLYFEGYTQSELADEFNIPLGTVKSRARKALKTLRKYFNIIIFWI